MKAASVAEVKSRLASVLKAAEGAPVLVTRNGRPVAVLVGVRDEDDVERLLMAYSPRLRVILDASRREIREGRGLGHEEFWAEFPESTPPKPKRRRQARNGKAAARHLGRTPPTTPPEH